MESEQFGEDGCEQRKPASPWPWSSFSSLKVLQLAPPQIQNNLYKQDLLRLLARDAEVEREPIVEPPARAPSTPTISSPFDVRRPLPANAREILLNNRQPIIFNIKPSERSGLDQMLRKILEGSSPPYNSS